MAALDGKIAVVTGASRGIGKGIALALAEQGATVVVSGRTSGAGPKTIDTTVNEIEAAGGKGYAIQCDHGDDAQIEAMFAEIGERFGRIDFLVNNVYKIPSPPAWGGGFWDHPIQVWDDQVGIGLRAHYVASWHAAKWLFAAGEGGSVANVSSPGGMAYHFSSSYGAGKAGLDRLTKDMAVELEPKGISTIALYPGSVLTEFIAEHADAREMDMSTMQTTLFVGRSIVALLASGKAMERTGKIQWVEDLAEEFDVVDEHGKRPPGYDRRDELLAAYKAG